MHHPTKRRKIKEETPEDKDDLQRTQLQKKILEIAGKARVKDLKEGDLNRILKALNSAIEEGEREVIDGSDWREIAEVLGVDWKAVELTFAVPNEGVSLMSRTEFVTLLKGKAIRLKLSLPSEIFGEKDYLNHIYVWKKFLYLKRVMQLLEGVENVIKSQICLWRGDMHAPCVQLEYQTKSGPLQLVLVPVLGEDVFPYRRFLLERNNVRRLVREDGQLRPTVHTNLAILRDITLTANVQYIDKRIDSMSFKSSILDVLTLIKVTRHSKKHSSLFMCQALCQNHLLDTFDGFDDVAWMIVMLRGLQRGEISDDMSALNVFCSTLMFLTSSKFNKMAKLSEEMWDFSQGAHKLVTSDKKFTAEAFKQLGMEFFVDATGGYNVAWDVSHLWMLHMKDIAKRALTAITDEHMTSGVETARDLFETRLPRPALFDSVIEVQVPVIKFKKQWDVAHLRSAMDRMEELLHRGLTDRYTILRFFSEQDMNRDSLDWKDVQQTHKVYIGIHVNKETAWRLVDKGPSGEDKAATKAFRSFWGDKSELKKFQDGSICEAVTWNVSQGHKHEIVDRYITNASLKTDFSLLRIVDHVITKHTKFKCWSAAEEIAFLFNTARNGSLETQAADFQKLQSALWKLSALVRGLEDIALRVVSVQEIDPSSRRTACFTTPYHPLADALDVPLMESVCRCVEPIEVLLGLETSGSWPVDLQAIEVTKTAMYAQLSAALKQSGHFAKASQNCVDLFLLGFVFRLYFVTEHEEQDGSAFILRKRYHSLVKKCTDRHASFPLAVKMLKRWTAANLFDFHLPEELIEVISLYIFEKKDLNNPIASPLSGFWSVLYLIAEFNWSTEALIVDIEQELSKNELDRMHKWYVHQKAMNPIPHFMAVCTPFDPESSLTKMHPDRAVVSRLQHLACQALKSCMDPLSNIFTASLTEFDALLHLRKEALAHPERALRLERQFHKKSVHDDEASKIVLSHIPLPLLEQFSQKQVRNQLLVGFDPVQKLWKDLTLHFGHVALFCCDKHGGQVVGIHWKPEMMTPTENPDLAQLTNWIKVDGGYVPDKVSILDDICDLGSGIIDNFEIC